MAVVPQDAMAFTVKADSLSNPHVVTQIPSSPHQPAAKYPLQTFQRANFVLCLFAAALAWPGWSQIQRGGWCWILAALLVLSVFSFLFLLQLSAVFSRKDAHWRWLLFFTLNNKWFKGRTVAFFFACLCPACTTVPINVDNYKVMLMLMAIIKCLWFYVQSISPPYHNLLVGKIKIPEKAGGDVMSLLKSCVPLLTNHSGLRADMFVSHCCFPLKVYCGLRLCSSSSSVLISCSTFAQGCDWICGQLLWFSWHLETYYAVLSSFWICTLGGLFNSNTHFYGAQLNKNIKIASDEKSQTMGIPTQTEWTVLGSR